MKTPVSGSSVHCPFCPAAATHPLWPGRGADEFRIERCSACGLAFTSPRLDDAAIAPYYAAAYYGQRHRVFLPIVERLMRWLRGRRAEQLAKLHSPGDVLDIGCGRGWTLARLRELGWRVQGIERGPEAAAFAREELRLDVRIGPFEPRNFADEQFDAIILWHVLEHMHNLGQALDGVARMLRPGGVLAVAAPNLDSWQAALGRYGWFHLDLPRHYWHFSRDWLVAALASRGLAVVAERHMNWEQNPYGWLQSLLNRLGLRRNLLYDLLRRGEARHTPHPWRDHPWQSALSLAGLVMFGPLALSLACAETLAGRGGTIELYAMRGELADAVPIVAVPT